jgi:hypothetical protein
MIIPGFVISIASFPGVIVHEAAHMLFCKLRGVPIFDVCFFRLGDPAGYVVHGEVDSFNSSFLISVGPFIINSLLCMVICFPAVIPMRIFGVNSPINYFLLWLGVSIGMHAFPSIGDAYVLRQQAKKAAASLNLLAIISFPLVVIIYIANILRFFWIDALYGFAIGILLPFMVLSRL